MIYWDASAKKVRGIGVTTDGMVIQTVWKKDGNAWTLDATTIDKSGKKQPVTARYTIREDSFDVELNGKHVGSGTVLDAN